MAKHVLSPEKRHTMKVSFDVREEVYLDDVKDFIRDALQSMGGCRHPYDPLFKSLKNVTSVQLRKPRN